jgi:hypothetical protein
MSKSKNIYKDDIVGTPQINLIYDNEIKGVFGILNAINNVDGIIYSNEIGNGKISGMIGINSPDSISFNNLNYQGLTTIIDSINSNTGGSNTATTQLNLRIQKRISLSLQFVNPTIVNRIKVTAKLLTMFRRLYNYTNIGWDVQRLENVLRNGGFDSYIYNEFMPIPNGIGSIWQRTEQSAEVLAPRTMDMVVLDTVISNDDRFSLNINDYLIYDKVTPICARIFTGGQSADYNTTAILNANDQNYLGTNEQIISRYFTFPVEFLVEIFGTQKVTAEVSFIYS